MKHILLIFICLFMFGCIQNKITQAFLEKITPSDDDKLAKELILNLRKNNLEFIISNFDKKQLGKKPKEILSKLYDYIDKQKPKKITLIGCNLLSFSNKRRSNLTYQIEFPNSWYTANIIIDTVGKSKKTMGFRINKISDSLENLNSFSLKNKKMKHYAILSLTLFVSLFILTTLILCIKSKVKKKWLWIIFILSGIGKLGINWSTGQILFQPFFLTIEPFLGSVYLKASPYAAWFFATSLPLGAIVFLIKRKKLLIENTENNSNDC